jgi:glutaminase
MIQHRHEFDIALQRIWREERGNHDGEPASYIPELARANPDDFGMAIMPINGRIHAAGDAEKPFAIQAISKALSFCFALRCAGYPAVAKRVGFEPGSVAFNAIELDPLTQKPFNPMVDAGAIAISGLLCETLGPRAFDILLACFSSAAGRRLSVNEEVYLSEMKAGNRHRAICHLLRSHGVIKADADTVLDLYFRQCAITVNAIDLATIGACLANMGENLTGEEVFDVNAVRLTLSVMFTCGMHDYAGNWACEVGIPAKGGIAGGIMGVINRQLGIACYSPRLDRKGNSVRAVRSFARLSDDLGLHVFDCTNAGSAVARAYLACW